LAFSSTCGCRKSEKGKKKGKKIQQFFKKTPENIHFGFI